MVIDQMLMTISEPAISTIDLVATLIIVFATAQALLRIVWVVSRGNRETKRKSEIWLEYGRWLVAALTFQLAADIIESSVVPTWAAIGQLGAVALVRTFLNYFLERDIHEVREREKTQVPNERINR